MAKRRVKQTKKSNSTTHHDHAPTGLYLVAIAAIVALVAMVTLFTDTDTTSMGLSEEDLAGQAIQPVTEPCAESDGGNDPYTKGYSTGTYPWGYAVLGGVPDKCRLNNNQPTASCTNCKLMEYYCVDDPNDPRYGHLFWEFYTGVDCVNGVAAQQPQSCSIAVATTYDLSDYPDIFNGTNSTFNGTLVTSATGPAEDVIAITNIAIGLQNEGYVVDSVRLDTEISNVCDQNIVVVGDVCENTVIQEILGYGAGDCADAYTDLGLAPNIAYIGLFESDDFIYLIVTGEDPEMRRQAADLVVSGVGMTGQHSFVIQYIPDCEDCEDYFEDAQDFIETLIDDLGDAIDDLNQNTTQFNSSLNVQVSTLEAANVKLSDVISLIQSGDYQDAEDVLDDVLDDVGDVVEDLFDIVNQIELAGYDEEIIDEVLDGIEALENDLNNLMDYLVINCP